MDTILHIIITGVIATLILDICATFAKWLKLPATNWGFVGRWLGHLPSGRFIHRPIIKSKPEQVGSNK